LLLEVEIGQLLLVPDRRVVENGGFEHTNPSPARERLERSTEQPRIGDHFGDDVDQGAETAADEDDPQPEGIGPPTYEVHDRRGLQDESPGIEETDEFHAVARTIVRAVENSRFSRLFSTLSRRQQPG
jgi:hypothetical protein